MEGEWLFLILKVGRFWRGCTPKSNALLGENRTGMSLIVQVRWCQQLRDDHKGCCRIESTSVKLVFLEIAGVLVF